MNRERSDVLGPDRRLVLISRWVCVAYWLLLTALLLLPLELLGIGRLPGNPGSLGVHFLIFTVLGTLVAAARWGDVVRMSPARGWPLPRVLLAVLVIVYAIATELAQSLVPTRECTLSDLLENLLGLAAGTVVWWAIERWRSRRPRKRG